MPSGVSAKRATYPFCTGCPPDQSLDVHSDTTATPIHQGSFCSERRWEARERQSPIRIFCRECLVLSWLERRNESAYTVAPGDALTATKIASERLRKGYGDFVARLSR